MTALVFASAPSLLREYLRDCGNFLDISCLLRKLALRLLLSSASSDPLSAHYVFVFFSEEEYEVGRYCANLIGASNHEEWTTAPMSDISERHEAGLSH